MTSPLTEVLLAHRRAGTTLKVVPPELVPADIDAAYGIQSETVSALGEVGAWKITPFPDVGEPSCSPLLASSIYEDGVALNLSNFPGLAIEVEVAVTLGSDLPEMATPEHVRDAIASVHLALELISSRFADRNSAPRLAAFADLQSSGGIVLGAPVPFSTLAELGIQAMTSSLDGQISGSTKTGPTTTNLLLALEWLARHGAERETPLTAGTVVITGARLGPVGFQGARAEAKAPGLGTVKLSFMNE